MSIWILAGISLAVVEAFVPLYFLLFVGARRAAVQQKARTSAIAALCAQRGLTTGPVHQPGHVTVQNPFLLHGLVNAFSSPDGSVVGGDTSRGDSRHIQFFSVLEFTVAGLNVPRLAALRIGQNSIIDVWGPVLELESTDFDKQFAVIAKDRRSAVMLLDQGMMQWLIDCELVSFEMIGDRVVAFLDRAAEPPHQPSEPVEFELLFKFYDGFVNRVPSLLRSEYAATG
ncbi:MAG TPA: hypothetical protein VN965_09035 [Candidatus Dormibacteraeota bacterium]|nr:hypothetical protein [Candidatus Dormibacteraeota bacterium]